jgi:hypothetical protein
MFSSCSSIPVREKQFKVDLTAPRVPAGTAEAQFDRFISGLVKNTVTVEYIPSEDIVCLQYRKDYVSYYLFWNKANRDAFVRALDNYKKDFEQKNFGKSSAKTKRQYGRVNGFLVWQTFRFSTIASGNPDIEFGYFFKDKRPYFTVTQRSVQFTEQSAENDRESPEIMMYFTRAQADILVGLFNQDFLINLQQDSSTSTSKDIEYEEYD